MKCNILTLSEFSNVGKLNFYGLKPKDYPSESTYFQCINSNLEKAQFYRCHFNLYKEIIVIDSFISDCLFISCQLGKNIRSLKGPGHINFEDSLKAGRQVSPTEYLGIIEAYRQLKVSASKLSDKVQESQFYTEELNHYRKTLKWSTPCNNQFWDKLILNFSKAFSDFGQSLLKPLIGLILGHWLLFILALIFGGFKPLQLSLAEPSALGFQQAFEKYVFYINPFRKAETTLSGYLIIIDTFMRIWSSYMIYNLIRASRRFIS